MKYFNKIFLTFLVLPFFFCSLGAAEKTAFLDIDYIVQNSNLGKKTLNKINELNNNNIKELKKKNNDLLELEKNIKNKKKIISQEEYDKEVVNFQKKISEFTLEKDKIVKDFNNFKKNELEKMFELYRPLISNYMEQNSVNILIDAKNIFMGNDVVNITNDILELINNELK